MAAPAIDLNAAIERIGVALGLLYRRHFAAAAAAA